MGKLRAGLERYFEFEKLGTNWRREFLAGGTTFVTMAYIIFVNPSILSEAGLPFAAVVAATCLCAAVASIMMGAFARYPIALAPGMGLNAYFAYTVVKGMGIPWQTALGAVFLSGLAFLLLTLAGVRQLIVASIPRDLYAAIAGGIGLFIALIGLRNAGLIVSNPATTVALGNLREPQVLLCLFGLVLTAALLAWQIRAAMLIGVLTTTLAGGLLGLLRWQPQTYSLSALTATAGKLDIASTFRLGFLEILFVFLFIDLFDNIGTLVAVTSRAGLLDEQKQLPRLSRVLITDSCATMFGSLCGTSTVVSYIESASGVLAGGRSGVTAITTGLLFFAALFVAPLVGVIPAAATAPALIIVGSLMASQLREIDWDNPLLALPAFLTLVMIPLTFSIANGLAIGFLAYTVLHMLRGRFREVHWFMYVLSGLFLLRFIYLGKG